MSDDNDEWDWARYYYFSKVFLNLADKEFWESNPRKIFALLEIHNELNSPVEDKKKSKIKQSNVQKATLEDFKQWGVFK